ncbi:hypothetical protein ACFL5P_02395 [candidate division KSB1 bacterium]
MFGLSVILIFFGNEGAAKYLAIVLFAAGIFTLVIPIRTKNYKYLTIVLFEVFLGLFYATIPAIFAHVEISSISIFFLVCGIFFLIWTYYLIFTRQLKWRGREILELAATPVEETQNGFTQRPHPIGKAEFTKEEVLEFAKFLLKNLIAIPYSETNRIVFVPIRGTQGYKHLYTFNPDYSKDTWISFDFDGNISVNITKEDYFAYKEDLSFNQLCESLGSLFIKFFDRFKKGEEIRIIDSLNTLKINPFE